MQIQDTLVDIIIVTWKTREMTCKCVGDALQRIEEENIPAKIWVVDNNSGDNTVETLKERFPSVSVIAHTSNAGFAIANNIAIRLSSAPYVLLLNSDAFLHENALTRMLDLLKKNPDVMAAGPRLIMGSGEVQHSVTQITTPLSQVSCLTSFYFPPFENFFRKRFHQRRDRLVAGDHARVVPLLSAACLLIRRNALEKIGLFPEDRFLYSEEDDFFCRMKRAGLKSMYVPEAEATHLCGESSKRTARKVKSDDFFIRSRLKFLFRHYPRAVHFTFLTHLFFFSWCAAFAGIKYALRKRDSDQQYMHDARVLIGIVREEYALLRRGNYLDHQGA
jgi:GT2 family glycosyltransferase